MLSCYRLTTVLLSEQRVKYSVMVERLWAFFFFFKIGLSSSLGKNRFYSDFSRKKKKEKEKKKTTAAACYSTATFTVVIISLTMMTVKILQLPVKTHK